MAYTNEHRFAARSAFVYQHKSLAQIGAFLKVSTRTVARWKDQSRAEGDDWDVARGAYSVSAQGMEAVQIEVLEDFLLVFKITVQEIREDKKATPTMKADALAKLSDSYNKVMAATAKASPQISKLATAMEVLHDFADFIRENFPKHAPALLEVLEPFGEFMSKKY